jgi:integrase
MECVRLRVKDLDFAYHQITVRDGKGEKDRLTILPQALVAPLQTQLRYARHLHAADLATGHGAVYLPHALDRKYPNAATDWRWQYIFPASKSVPIIRSRNISGRASYHRQDLMASRPQMLVES